jgi:FecR protein
MSRVGASGWGCAAGLFVAVALLVGTAPSLGQENTGGAQNIGGAMVVVNKVDGALPTGKIKVIQGDAVFRDEGVTTDAESSAKLVLKDDTNITIGPNSSIKLDRFVYSGAEQPGTIAIHLAKGTFRMVTGNADKNSYVITTPTAAIGVRGTEFFVSVTPTQTHVHVEGGRVEACMREHEREFGTQYCLDLGQNQTGNVTNSGAAIDNSPTDPAKQTFDALCQGGLCGFTPFSRFASNNTNNQIGSLGAGPNGGAGGGQGTGGGSGGAVGETYGSTGGGGGGGGGNGGNNPSGGSNSGPVSPAAFGSTGGGGGTTGGGSTLPLVTNAASQYQ